MARGLIKQQLQNLLSKLVDRPRITSTLLFAAALIYFFLFPTNVLEKKTYFSENALAVGSANYAFSERNAQEASNIANEFCKSGNLEYIRRQLQSFGLETIASHNFSSPTAAASSDDSSTALLYSVLRAPKGNGKESIALIVPFNKCDSLGVALAVIKLLSQAKWMHHDILFISYNNTLISNIGELQPTTSSSSSSSSTSTSSSSSSTSSSKLHQYFLQIDKLKEFGGEIREALHLDVSNYVHPRRDFHLAIEIDGFNGELPNLDLVNVAVAYARDYEHFDVSLQHVPFERFMSKVKRIPMLQTLVEQYEHEPLFQKYVNLLRTLWIQVLSVPTNLHGLFRSGHTIHSISFANTQGQDKLVAASAAATTANEEAARIRYMRSMGIVIESTIRSMNNLIEQMHQSFFLYFMTGLSTFVGYENYIAGLWLFVSPFLFIGFANYYSASFKNKLHQLTVTFNSFLIVIVQFVKGFATLFIPALLATLLRVTDAAQGLGIFWVVTFAMEAVTFLWTTRRLAQVNAQAELRETNRKVFVGFFSLVIAFGLGALTVYHNALSLACSIYLFVLLFTLEATSNKLRVIRLAKAVFYLLLSPLFLMVVLPMGLEFLSTMTSSPGSSSNESSSTNFPSFLAQQLQVLLQSLLSPNAAAPASTTTTTMNWVNTYWKEMNVIRTQNGLFLSTALLLIPSFQCFFIALVSNW